MDARAVIAKHGGLAATHELRRAGVGRTALTTALDQRQVLRARQGWYANSSISPTLLRAARVGGRATCLTALALADAWTPQHSDLHVAVPPNACRLRSADDSRSRLGSGVVVHWSDDRAGDRLSVGLEVAILDALSCSAPELVAAAADSAYRRHSHLRRVWARVLSAAPERARSALRLVDGVCESGTETLFWSRTRPLAMDRQVVIPGVGRVDFLIGDRLVVEIDGAEYHSSSNQFERDRARDAALGARGYRVLRFSYWQVMVRWAEVETALRASIARADHL